MVEITNLRQGAVLNHNHGVESDKALRIRVEGLSSQGCPVTVNGVPAVMDGRRFIADVDLTQKVNIITAATVTPYGNYSQELTALWDKKSFKRYHFYIDDHIFVFTDLARQRPAKAFDHFYLKGLKNIHDKYGTKFVLNTFYHNAHDEFLLKDMPDTWKQEFMDNADWLKFSFHAYSEFPDRPYQHASAETLANDYDLVRDEIIRFAGEKTFIPPVGIHWGMVNPDSFKVLHDRGVRMLDGEYLCGKVSLDEKDSVARVADVGYFYEKDVTEYIWGRKVFYDRFADLFLSRCDLTVNMVPLQEIRAGVEAAANHPNYRTLLDLSSHEQYSFPGYFNYLPDHMQRLDETCKAATELGYQSVFFADGLLGNPVWE